MKITYMINNYTLGAYFKATPQQYLVCTERIDSRHTRVIYDVPNSKVVLRRIKNGFCYFLVSDYFCLFLCGY